MSSPSKTIVPLRSGDKAEDRAKRRRLARAVAADQRDRFARGDVQRDVEQHVRLAVGGVESCDRELELRVTARLRRARRRRDRPPEPPRWRAPPPARPRRSASPRLSTSTRSAWPNTTSMSCSVNSTPIVRSRARRAVRPISAWRSLGAMPAAGSSISSNFGSLASAMREFEPLQVAVGELAATALRLIGHADEIEQARRLADVVARRPAKRRPTARMMREQRHLDVFRDRHRGESRGDLEGPPDAQAPDVGAASCRRCSGRRCVMRPLVGASWPLIMAKQVLLPAPFGPMSASISPASSAKLTSLTAWKPE